MLLLQYSLKGWGKGGEVGWCNNFTAAPLDSFLQLLRMLISSTLILPWSLYLNALDSSSAAFCSLFLFAQSLFEK